MGKALPMLKNQYGQYLLKVIDEMKEDVTVKHRLIYIFKLFIQDRKPIVFTKAPGLLELLEKQGGLAICKNKNFYNVSQ